MVLALRKSPDDMCELCITCARDLLLCRDGNYECSPHIFAENFDKICSAECTDLPEGQVIAPSKEEMERNPCLFLQFITYRAQSTHALRKVPLPLLEALAHTYATLNYTSELAGVSSFIKTCFVEVPHNVRVMPVVESSKICSVRYVSGGGRAFCRGKLIVKEQCLFRLENEEGKNLESGTGLLLSVEYGISSHNKRVTLFYLTVRQVKATLVKGNECGFLETTGKTCTWHAAHKLVKEFCVTTFGLFSNVTGFKFSIYRTQPGNAEYLSRRVFANTGTSGGLIRSLLSALLGKPYGSVRVTFGHTSVWPVEDGLGMMYNVHRRVLVRVDGMQTTCFATVRYGVCGSSQEEKVSSFIYDVLISPLREADLGEAHRLLHDERPIFPLPSTLLTLNCSVVLFSASLLEDSKKLLSCTQRNNVAYARRVRGTENSRGLAYARIVRGGGGGI